MISRLIPMFNSLIATLKANSRTMVFTEGHDPRILEASARLLADGLMKVVLVGNIPHRLPIVLGNAQKDLGHYVLSVTFVM